MKESRITVPFQVLKASPMFSKWHGMAVVGLLLFGSLLGWTLRGQVPEVSPAPIVPAKTSAGIDMTTTNPPPELPTVELVERELKDVPPVELPPEAPRSVTVATGGVPNAQMLREARAFLEQQKFDEALARYDRVLATATEDVSALAGAVFALERLNNVARLEKMTADHRKFAAAPAAVARLKIARNDLEAALPFAQKASEREPSNTDHRLALAVLEDRLGHGEIALVLYRSLPMRAPAVQQRMEYLAKTTP